MSNVKHCFSLLLSICLLASCGNNNSSITPEDLDGTTWALTQMPGELPAGVDIRLQFDAERISGKGVCNNYFSRYELTDNKISFQAIGATEMMCMEHSDVEVKYFQTLEKAEEIGKSGDRLTLKTSEGDLVFKAAEPADAE